MEKFNFIEKKGIVEFLSDSKGRLFQKLGCNEPIKVRDGKMSYKPIMRVLGFDIKYNLNGVQGFCVFKNKVCLEDNIWTTEEAERIARELK